MSGIMRYLITTDDERTWKFDRPVIFLGEWCRSYARKNIWQNMDAIVADPYGLGQAKQDLDYAEARNLEEKLFPRMCETLNKFHGSNHGARFWEIVLGHWFHRYVDVVLNRVRTLELCLQNYQLSGMTSFCDAYYCLATQDSYAAIWAFNDARWNSALFSRILQLLDVTISPLEIIYSDKSEGFSWSLMGPESNHTKRILKWCYQLTRKLVGVLARESDAFIVNSFLPRKEEIKLQLSLRQIPQFWISPKPKLFNNSDMDLRQNLTAELECIKDNDLARILSTLLFELLPVCYLEGFPALIESVRHLPWPKKPKFIFTSNNFDTDEVFKLWTATKVESGFKYLTGQHGNNYGTYRYMYPAIEEVTADKFLTWGWTDGLPQHTQAFIFKTAGTPAKVYNPNGGLLLMELHAGLMLSTWDVTAEFKGYFEDQQLFISKLNDDPRGNLVVRLHHGYVFLKWSEEDRWKAFDREIQLDTGYSDINKLIAQSRLIVQSYDSTGILENFAQNIPMIAFWQNGLGHLRDGAKPYYQLLVDAGIVHFTPESAAAQVNAVWDDVLGWWEQDIVQEARRAFCDRYCRVSPNPITELRNILLHEANDNVN